MANNILIIDDHVELTQILGEYFRIKKGYNVLTAADGKVALNIIHEQTPELVLLDMKLPSVNGLEILKILRKDYPNSRVIVMTAYDTEYKKEIDAVGYDAFFIKPILFEELKDTVDALLSGKPLKFKKSTIQAAGIMKEEGKQPLADTGNMIPKARIAIIELKEAFGSLLKTYLEGLGEAEYSVAVFGSGSLYFNKISEFKPDIVLYDILEITDFSEIASKLLNLHNPPKEIVLFGDPQFKWEDVDSLIKEGMNYIPTPLSYPGQISEQYHEFELPAKEAVDKLVYIIKEACFKHGLLTKKR